jgi:alpha-1,3/alpha-1,6-mannosyltransferase
VLDAATELRRRGCRVRFFVPGPLEAPQFREVSDAVVAVEEVAPLLPVHIFGRLRAAMAIGRTVAAANALVRAPTAYDLIFCDVTSHVVPFVKRRTGRPVLFFCHFPDLLLTTGASRASLVYRKYRRLIDRLETAGLLAADRVVVNSAFTATKVREAFPVLRDAELTVVHPGVIVPQSPIAPISTDSNEIVVLSVSRFDPRKQLEVAIEALALLRTRIAPLEFARVRLIMAGRYDATLHEQTVVLRNLRTLARRMGVTEQVVFVLSPTSEERDRLLALCRAVIYTPSAEHFGYVPLEAMAAGRPVVAANNGGPAETVVHGRTGLLCPPDAAAFADALAELVTRTDLAQRFGGAGRDHVQQHFSIEAFGRRLWQVVAPFLDVKRCPVASS